MYHLTKQKWSALLLLIVLISGYGVWNQGMAHKSQGLSVTPPPECGEPIGTESQTEAGPARQGLPASTEAAFTVVGYKQGMDKAALVCKGGILVLIDHTLGHYGTGQLFTSGLE